MHAPRLLLSLIAALLLAFAAGEARAHCDSLDGPVVRDARLALESRDPAPALKWVAPESEAEVREAFRSTLAVRSKGAQAQQLADRYFFETVVRLHRASEGEGFTGLKAAGSVDPEIAAADRALEAGSAADLSRDLSARVSDGIQARFRHAAELRKHAGDSAPAGRAYVAAYVAYVKFVEETNRLVRLGAPLGHHDAPAH